MSTTTDDNNTAMGAVTAGDDGGAGMDTTTTSHNQQSNAASLLFQTIPPRLRIQIIYQDDDIIVVTKPCGLRSVPGNADAEDNVLKSSLDRKRPRSPTSREQQQRLTAQQAWTEAIRLLAMTNKNTTTTSTTTTTDTNTTTSSSSSSGDSGDSSSNDNNNNNNASLMSVYLQRLGANPNRLASIPRKYPTFCRYIRRSHARLFETNSDTSNDDQGDKNDDDSRLETLIQQLYCRIEKCQRSLMHLPEPTKDEESVLGQLKLLGLASTASSSSSSLAAAALEKSNNKDDGNHYDSRSNQTLFPVHRLDCETSGVMVVARTREAASVLSRAWREKSQLQNNSNNHSKTKNATKNKVQVHKVYHALVQDWKPWREQHQRQGIIDLPLAPHPTQRIKWVAIYPALTLPTNNSNNDSIDSVAAAAAKPSLTHWKVLLEDQQDDGAATAASSTTPSKAHGPASAPTTSTATAATASTEDDGNSSSNKNNCNHVVSPVRLELLPITGRTHQLRVHCAATGGAIIGDALYNASAAAAAAAAADDVVPKQRDGDGDNSKKPSFLYLHAYQLSFPHPSDEEREMKFTVAPAW
jgi:23S rRNA-/tRNA-specific pseudouridylate synthase